MFYQNCEKEYFISFKAQNIGVNLRFLECWSSKNTDELTTVKFLFLLSIFIRGPLPVANLLLISPLIPQPFGKMHPGAW